MKITIKSLLVILFLLSMNGCSPINQTPNQIISPALMVSTDIPTLSPSATYEKIIPRQTNQPHYPTSTPVLLDANSSNLLDYVQGKYTLGTNEYLNVLPLESLPDWPPLWVVYSDGFLQYWTKDPPHFLAIYSQDSARNWQELSWISLQSNPNDLGPTFLTGDKVWQVKVEPKRIWLAVEGGLGTHSGMLQLLSFNGQRLKMEFKGGSSNPEVGYLEDLNHDGQQEVIHNITDYYVGCYGCGVRKYGYEVYRWNPAHMRMTQIKFTFLPSSHPKTITSSNNLAVSLAQAGLWKDALAQIEAVMDIAALEKNADLNSITWNYVVIKLHTDTMSKDVIHGPSPLFANVFYGDYAAAVDLLRPYKPNQLFSENVYNLEGLAFSDGSLDYIIDAANDAVKVKSKFAPIYFMRAWATYVMNPYDPKVKEDVEIALSLSPDDPLYKATNEFFD